MPTVSKGYNSSGQTTFTAFSGYDRLIEIPFSPQYEDPLSQFKIVENPGGSSGRVSYIYKNPIDIHGGVPYTFSGTGGYSRDGIVKSNNFSGYKYWFRCYLVFSAITLARCAMDSNNPDTEALISEMPDFKTGDPGTCYGFGTNCLMNDIGGITQSTFNSGCEAGDFLLDPPQTFLGTTAAEMGYDAELDWMKDLYVQSGAGWRTQGYDKTGARVTIPDGSCWIWDQHFAGQRLQNAGSNYPISDGKYSSPLFLGNIFKGKISIFVGTSFLLYTDLLNITPRPWTYYFVKSNIEFVASSAPDDSDKLPGTGNIGSGNPDFGYIIIVGVEQ